jgi:hypothetical protein
VTVSAVVAEVQAYAKINTAGEWIDRSETVSLNQLFEQMSTQELENYAQTGAVPDWFQTATGATSYRADDCLKLLKTLLFAHYLGHRVSAFQRRIPRTSTPNGEIISRWTGLPYPLTAKYVGTGSIDDAKNFIAGDPKPAPADKLNWLGSSFYSAHYEQGCSANGATMSCKSSQWPNLLDDNSVR